MEFRITLHSGSVSHPRSADAMDQLWQRLGPGGVPIDDEASFTRVGDQIWVTWGPELAASPERRERSEIGRNAVVEIVREACSDAQELEFDWFAVGFIH